MRERPWKSLAVKDREDLPTYLSLTIPVYRILRSVSPRPRVSVSVNLHIHGDSETSQDFRICPRRSLAEVLRDAGAQ